MLRLVIAAGVCAWKMEALYVLKVVLSPSLLQSRLLEKGVLGTVFTDGCIQKNVNKLLIFYKDGACPGPGEAIL